MPQKKINSLNIKTTQILLNFAEPVSGRAVVNTFLFFLHAKIIKIDFVNFFVIMEGIVRSVNPQLDTEDESAQREYAVNHFFR